MRLKKKICLLLASAFPLFALAAGDQTPSVPHQRLREVAQKAILTNPEVMSRFHNLSASAEEVDFARGAYFPRVDVAVGTGREKLRQPSAVDTVSTTTYSRNTGLLSLNQMLFDGFATSNEVKRLNKAKAVRYYELLDASENTALEATRAYLDVLRYRFLLNLAEDNYVQHKATYDQLMQRTQSGVGRRVDLEQAASRLALAEINLATEKANLHDVSARYQRLTNEQPPKIAIPPASLTKNLPKSAKEAVNRMHLKSPSLLAAQENIEAANYEIEVKRAALMPRVDLKLRQDNTTNYMGYDENRRNSVAEVVLSYNIFNGGSDIARKRQYAEKKNVAVDLRDKSCRDNRQTLLIAYNDISRLSEQAAFVSAQVDLLEKTRDAYRDQFNVGQRTLLDVLDTENELLSARRSAVNTDIDLSLAYLRTYAGMGELLEFLGLQKIETDVSVKDDLSSFDTSTLCPAVGVDVPDVDRMALNTRAARLIEDPRPVAPVLPVKAEGSPVNELLDTWVAAWSRKDFPAYQGFYAKTFTPDGGLSREDWIQLRRSRLSSRDTINVSVQDVVVKMDGADRAYVEFRQNYQSNVYNDTVRKAMELIRVDGKWLINKESSVPCEGNTVGGCALPKRPLKKDDSVKGGQ